MDLTRFAEDVHKNAVEHGWWEDERSFGEIVALCHSELSEALEEYRARRPLVYCIDHTDDEVFLCVDQAKILEMGAKPEGIAVELADCIIRILDWFGQNGIDADHEIEAGKGLRDFVFRRDIESDIGTLFSDLHLCLSMAYRNWRNGHNANNINPHMGLCIAIIYDWAEKNSLNLDPIIEMKHQYNKGRPYRHGGKAL